MHILIYKLDSFLIFVIEVIKNTTSICLLFKKILASLHFHILSNNNKYILHTEIVLFFFIKHIYFILFYKEFIPQITHATNNI